MSDRPATPNLSGRKRRADAPDPMPPLECRAALERMGLSQYGLARLLQDLGDTRPLPTIIRTVAELARLDRTTPAAWSVVVLVRLLEKWMVLDAMKPAPKKHWTDCLPPSPRFLAKQGGG